MSSSITEKIHLLVVEDNVPLTENLREYFNSDRYELDFASDAGMALDLISRRRFDILILDIMLPGMSGLELCRKVRRELSSPVPIILMTAKDQLDDKEAGFNHGADDYLTKPFHLRELQLRIEALQRRHSMNDATVVVAGGISFNPGTLEVSLDGTQAVELSGRAADIFEILIRCYPNYVSHEQLEEKVWGRMTEIHTMRSHVYALRKQLQRCFGTTLIKTIHSRGYRLMSPEES